jgi:hypothetical protein
MELVPFVEALKMDPETTHGRLRADPSSKAATLELCGNGSPLGLAIVGDCGSSGQKRGIATRAKPEVLVKTPFGSRLWYRLTLGPSTAQTDSLPLIDQTSLRMAIAEVVR